MEKGTPRFFLILKICALVTGDPVICCTSIGVINQAILCADTYIGFYGGGIGTAFAVARVEMLLQNDVLMRYASRLLHTLMTKKQDEHEFDMSSGNAGAIAALVILQDILDDVSLLDFLVQLGDCQGQSIGHNNSRLTVLSQKCFIDGNLIWNLAFSGSVI